VDKTVELQGLCREAGLDVLMVSESHLLEGEAGPRVKGYKWWGRGRNVGHRGGGGVGFLVRASMSVTELPELQGVEGEEEEVGREYMFVKVGVGRGEKIVMGVVYGRQAGDPGAGEWNERLLNQMQGEISKFQQEGYQVLIGGI
jgi:hypothetical protein